MMVLHWWKLFGWFASDAQISPRIAGQSHCESLYLSDDTVCLSGVINVTHVLHGFSVPGNMSTSTVSGHAIDDGCTFAVALRKDSRR